MNFLIRADASREIGSGHIMRCIAIGQILQDEGYSIHIITKTDNSNILDRLVKENFTVKVLDKKVNIIQDALATCKYAKEISAEWIITDGYKFNTEYQKRIKERDFKLLCIDDISKFHFASDIVLNQNINSEKHFKYSCEKYTKLLLGIKYVLLRREFREDTDWKRIIKDKCKNILITMGGSDEFNITQKVIDSLQEYPMELNINIVLGYTNETGISAGIRNGNKKLNIKIYRNVENMVPLIKWCDIAICTSGSVVWEMIRFGTPMLTGYVADNQIYSYLQLKKENLVFSAGDYRKIDTFDLTCIISNIIESYSLRYAVRNNINTKFRFDGPGLELWMIFNNIVISKAAARDVNAVYELSNEPRVRSVSINKGYIKFEDHRKWFEKKIKDAGTKFYVIYRKSLFIGQVRFDITGECALISISVTPEYRGKGYSGKVLKLSCNKIFFENEKINYIEAYIIPGNISSIKIFEKSGFILKGSTEIKKQKLLKYILNR